MRFKQQYPRSPQSINAILVAASVITMGLVVWPMMMLVLMSAVAGYAFLHGEL